ncbi:adult-specific cuticular protein ACP-22-like [Linepithema humile]|uniref:adult-specific cuticular protein ACP-22-like n=1 Tax=Linepithema humile TaxID=83485 RepID=UPI0006236462|nr:PREDICTED: adult-specific cuticular protein ACP-22-like [Linepithema humile]XP_012227041.1 PREDICTED: adult-specific cuticular protein ACP-22-like [Linepithema humile]
MSEFIYCTCMRIYLVLFVFALSTLLLINATPDGHAHSFQHFHGPVAGKEREVTWDDDHGHHHEDYVAHPHYAFSYGVEDHHTGDYHGQKEHRDGTEVFGEYTVKEPDGNIRTVKYRAGKDGFHAKVHNSHRSDDQQDAHHHDDYY